LYTRHIRTLASRYLDGVSEYRLSLYNSLMDYKYTGIILGKRDVGETDRIYTIYTLESGKIRVLAKSVRKANAKLAGFMENFNLAEIFVAKSQGMGKITGSLVVNNFSNIRGNLEVVKNVFDSIRLLNGLIKDEVKDQKIFKLLRDYLETMDDVAKGNNQNKNETVSLGFTFKLFGELGYGLEVGNCAYCQERIKEGDNFFDPEQGGIVCKKCLSHSKTKVKASPNTIKIIRVFFQNSLRSLIKLRVDRKDLDNLKVIEKEFLRWIE
jgi:DNA repair protein RecO (recombination protein O)